MTIEELLKNSKSQFSLNIFSAKNISTVEETLSDKGGKFYLKCCVRKKDVLAKPEEIIRQLWLARLEQEFLYANGRLAVEYPITFGRDSSKRADIAVFDADRPTVPYIIIEVKQPTERGGKDQLKSYCHATGAPLALWSDGLRQVTWHRKNPNYFIVIPELPTAQQTIEDIVREPWTIETLLEKEKQRETEGLKSQSLRQLIEDLENEVLANAGVDVFEEVFKLIFTKLYDELACHRKWKGQKYLRFRNQNTAAQLKVAIQALFDEAKAKWGGVFSSEDKIKLTPDHLSLYRLVGRMEAFQFQSRYS